MSSVDVRTVGQGASPPMDAGYRLDTEVYLQEVGPALAALLPQAKAARIPEYDHNGPDLSGPERVAALIRA